MKDIVHQYALVFLDIVKTRLGRVESISEIRDLIRDLRVKTRLGRVESINQNIYHTTNRLG